MRKQLNNIMDIILVDTTYNIYFEYKSIILKRVSDDIRDSIRHILDYDVLIFMKEYMQFMLWKISDIDNENPWLDI